MIASKLTFLFLFLFVLSGYKLIGQRLPYMNLDSLGEVLKKEMPKEFVFTSRHKMTQSSYACGRQSLEYERNLSKDSIYCISLQGTEGLYLFVMDSMGEMIAENYKNRHFVQKVVFQPPHSGMYYLNFRCRGHYTFQGIYLISTKPSEK